MLSTVFRISRGCAGANSVFMTAPVTITTRVHATAGCPSVAKTLHISPNTLLPGCIHLVCGCLGRTVRANSTSTCPCLGQSVLLRVLPSLDKPGHKFILSLVRFGTIFACRYCFVSQHLEFTYVQASKALAVMQEDKVEFYLVKSQDLHQRHQYQWQLVDEHADFNGQLSVSYEGQGDGVQMCDEAGAVVSEIDLCRGAYYTVIKFTWSSKTYRYPCKSKTWPLDLLHGNMS